MILPFLILAGGTLLYGIVLSYLAALFLPPSQSQPGLGRKVFHIGIFTGAVPPQLLLGFWGVVVYGTVIAVLVLQGYLRGRGSLLYRTLARSSDGDRHGRYVVLPLVATAMGGLASVLLVGEFAVVGYLVCGWGDAAGEMVGKRWGRRVYALPLPWIEEGQKRTVEGSLAVAGVGFLAAAMALALLGEAPLSVLATGLACGVAGAGAEALSGHGTDNFWVQLIPSLLGWWVLG